MCIRDRDKDDIKYPVIDVAKFHKCIHDVTPLVLTDTQMGTVYAYKNPKAYADHSNGSADHNGSHPGQVWYFHEPGCKCRQVRGNYIPYGSAPQHYNRSCYEPVSYTHLDVYKRQVDNGYSQRSRPERDNDSHGNWLCLPVPACPARLQSQAPWCHRIGGAWNVVGKDTESRSKNHIFHYVVRHFNTFDQSSWASTGGC